MWDILHFDKYLGQIIQSCGVWTYCILFITVFAETGFVATPFLPGDTLLFAVGAFAAIGSLDLYAAALILMAAAILGDTFNYFLGKILGPKVFSRNDSRLFRKEYIDRTERFYEKYGAKTIVLARFVPIIRTFAPFVAGIGRMKYSVFFFYNAIGGVLWVLLFVLAGYFLGNITFIKNNFNIVILVIIIVSLSPVIFEIRKHYIKSKN